MSHWPYALIGIAAFVYIIQRNVRFLLQGRRYRRLRADERAALADQDRLWHEYHGRRIPAAQLIVGIIVAALIFGTVVCRSLGLF